MPWKVELLDRSVHDELAELSPEMQARFLRISELLQTLGPLNVGMPHVRPLGEKIWEMRLHDRHGIARALYCAVAPQRLVVLHVFSKKTQKTPRSAIKLARARMATIKV